MLTEVVLEKMLENVCCSSFADAIAFLSISYKLKSP